MRRTHDQGNELAISFFHGWIAKSIEEFAQRINLPASELASRLAALLSTPANGQVLGTERHLSGVPYQAPQRSEVLEPMAVALESHSNRAPAKRGRGTGDSKNYWAKMTKAERSAEMKRRMAKWSNGARNRWHHKIRLSKTAKVDGALEAKRAKWRAQKAKA